MKVYVVYEQVFYTGAPERIVDRIFLKEEDANKYIMDCIARNINTLSISPREVNESYKQKEIT